MSVNTLLVSAKVLLLFLAIALLAGIASAQVNGSIFTTTSTGATVNGNIYDAKTDVYLNGGPQNKQDPGIVPDGTYYFQVTDPSGAVLLSADDITCRQVVVTGGRIVSDPSGAAPAACTGTTPPGTYHPLGTFNSSNGEQPVQLCPATPSARSDNLGNGSPLFDASNWCDNTPNPGGEYKAWLTPVANYSPDPLNPKCSTKSDIRFGFCDSDSKTDNFKVKSPNAAYITVCKFNDLDGSGTQDSGEPLIPFWPINATGVDTLTGPLGTVNTQTDANGCVSFSVSTFPNSDHTDTVTLTETLLTGWLQTAPLDGTYGQTSVSAFTETINLKAGDSVIAPNFGNFCVNSSCGGMGLVVTKDANPSFTRTFVWDITKSVDTNLIDTHGNGATFNYTVSVTHDTGTDSAWQVTGTIKVSNPNPVDVPGVDVSDAVDNGGNCTLMGGSNITVPANSEVDVPYTCTYSALPAPGTNTATAQSSATGSSMGTASIDFTNAAIHAVDGMITVTDTLDGTLGTVTYTDPSPTTFTYAYTFNGDPAGTCTSHKNTATFTTNTTSTTGSASQTVQDCQGADLVVSKTAATAYTAAITKSVAKTLIEQAGGTATLNYTVNVTTSGWSVSGNISVTNPNDWEDITANVGDALSDSGGSCAVTGGTGVFIARTATVTLPYTCLFAVSPTAGAGMNTATATWNSVTYSTPHGSATGTAAYAFSSLTITDCFGAKGQTCTLTTLGTVNIPPGAATFTYSHVVNAPAPGTCQEYDNTATIVQTGQSANAAATVCNIQTGALTMGFWQNKNGQGIITGQAKSGVCASGTWLRQFNPFQDLSATATCSQVATYVYNVIKAATCGGSTCNPMLKSQMLATALDVYFSTSSLGGNKIGAFNGLGSKQPAIGSIAIDLSHICSMADSASGGTCTGVYEDARPEFGILAPCLGTTVGQMLSYSNFASATNGNPVSNVGGTTWYQQSKSKQVFAKDGFDNINNQIANITTNSCSSMF